jgi:hypothetical protein
MRGPLIRAEVDRRLGEIAERSGQPIPREVRRKIRRKMERELQAALPAEFRAEVQQDRRRAFYPDLAQRLLVAGEADDPPVYPPVYLRMGEMPTSGFSRSLFGHREPGASVFAGTMTGEGHYILDARGEWLHYVVVQLFGRENRPALFVRGASRGLGTDGEPLLAADGITDVRPVPGGCLVAIEGGSNAVDVWNIRRLGRRLEEDPELARYCSHDQGGH